MKNCCWFLQNKCVAESNPQPAENFSRDRKRDDGRTVHCKSCLKVIRLQRKEYQNAYTRKWRKKNPLKCKQYTLTKKSKKNAKARKRKYILKTRYGISIEQWNDMYEEQKGQCPICLLHMNDCVEKQLHVDHCHKTGKVRGLLCSTCNKAIGLLKDDSGLLQRAISFLEKSLE